jgi:hypothetical protein
MLFRRRQFDPKLRRQVALGTLCLSGGLALMLFVQPSGQIAKDAVHGIAGMLIGISLGVNLFAVGMSRRCGGRQADQAAADFKQPEI